MNTSLTVLEQQIVDLLTRDCLGESNAIHISKLVRRLWGVGPESPKYPTFERKARLVIKHLVERHGAAIVSSYKVGIFIPEQAAEVDSAYKRLRQAGLSHLTRAARLRKQSLPDLLGQLKLEVDDAR